MRQLLAVVVLAAILGACSSTREQASEIGSSISSGVGRNSDTYGTMRRPDVYGGFTQPTLPTMGTGR